MSFPAETVDPLYFEATYYMHPELNGEALYSALFRQLRETTRVGIGTIVLNHRRRHLLVRSGRTGIVASTIFYREETRLADEFPGPMSGQDALLDRRVVEATLAETPGDFAR